MQVCVKPLEFVDDTALGQCSEENMYVPEMTISIIVTDC